MADKAVSTLTQVTNHAAIGNCLMVSQNGSGTGSTNSSLISALQVNYTQVANAYPFGNGDGNAYGVRTLATAAPAFQTINDMWYDITASSWTASNSTVYVINQSINAFIKATSVYVKQAGAWTQVKEAWIKNAGAWVRFLYVKPITYITITGGNNINLRSVYQTQTGDYSATPVSVHFLVTGNIGSSSTATAAMATGTWPAGSDIIVNVSTGVYVVGAGGAGGNNGAGNPGGNAISLNYNMTIVNNGIIGGGGGGAGSQSLNPLGYVTVGGGGGAGLVAGAAGVGSRNAVFVYGAAGSLTSGGVGCYRGGSTSGQTVCTSDRGGGSLGQGGTSIPDGPGGGAAGKAIALNGYVATRTGNAPIGSVS